MCTPCVQLPCRQHYSLFCYALLNCSRFLAIYKIHQFNMSFLQLQCQWQFRTASVVKCIDLFQWSKPIIALQEASYHSDPPESLTASILEFLKVCLAISSASWLYILAISPLQSALSAELPLWIWKALIGKSHIWQITTAHPIDYCLLHVTLPNQVSCFISSSDFKLWFLCKFLIDLPENWFMALQYVF